jgi:excisionase family DNA binding protein
MSMTLTDAERLITTLEAAKLANCGPDTIRRWSTEGTLPIAVRLGSGQRLFRRSDVMRAAAVRDERAELRSARSAG